MSATGVFRPLSGIAAAPRVRVVNRAAYPHRTSILRGLFDVIDDQHLDGTFGPLQSEPELFPYGGFEG